MLRPRLLRPEADVEHVISVCFRRTIYDKRNRVHNYFCFHYVAGRAIFHNAPKELFLSECLSKWATAACPYVVMSLSRMSTQRQTDPMTSHEDELSLRISSCKSEVMLYHILGPFLVSGLNEWCEKNNNRCGVFLNKSSRSLPLWLYITDLLTVSNSAWSWNSLKVISFSQLTLQNLFHTKGLAIWWNEFPKGELELIRLDMNP